MTALPQPAFTSPAILPAGAPLQTPDAIAANPPEKSKKSVTPAHCVPVHPYPILASIGFNHQP